MRVHLCLDLGTAFSKASAWGSGGRGRPRPLPIGNIVGGGDYIVPTAVCISEGRVCFGQEALTAGRESLQASAFTGLKQFMTHEPVRGLGQVTLPDAYKPARTSVTVRQVNSLYMAFLSKAASRCLGNKISVEGQILTMPVFRGRRRDNMKNELRLAAQYGWQLSKEIGWHGWSLNLNEALALLRRMETRARTTNVPAILEEPPAVMASRMATYSPDDGGRQLYMIVDIGAGTTDFGLFVAGHVDGRVGVHAIRGSKYSLQRGGNDIDDALVKCILEKSKLNGRERPVVKAALREQARLLKEELLAKKIDEPMAVPDAKIELTKEEFIDSPSLKAIRSKVKDAFEARLKAVDVSWLNLASKLRHGITVFFVGGGGRLEFLRDVVPQLRQQSYNGSSQFYFRIADDDPSWADEDGFRQTWRQIDRIFPQMAVSLGGAAYGAEVNDYLKVERELVRWGGLAR